MNTASLRDFVTPVPARVETESLGSVWQLVQQSEVVIVNSQQIPIGLLSAQQLMTLLSPDALANALPEQTIAQLRGSHPLLEPLTPLPIDWTLKQFQPYLHDVDQEQWVLVNETGQYIGLLDRLRLLKALAVQPIALPLPEQPRVAQAVAQPAREAAADGVALTLSPLLDLLERLPLPLMLQTTAGQVITQNGAWRQQVGELRDPGQVQQEAALFLESSSPDSDNRHYSSDAINSWQGRSADPQIIDPDSDDWDSPDTHRHRGSCRLGTEPNTCVCICPMKTGQDRIWQFIRIPMGVAVATQPQADMAREAVLNSDAAPFKLATLSFSPDPNWRALTETELWLVLAQDMTEQQQVARELAAKNADLVQLNRLKDEFLACISHELKTPLTAILGLSSLLKDQSLGQLNDRQFRYAQLIHQSGRHLILVVNDILDLTRIETGQLELMLESVSIEKVCTRAYEQVRQIHPLDIEAEQPPPTEVQLTLDIQPELDSIVADELRLRQMLVNLLSNAIKFTEIGGEIGLKVEQWEGWIAFTVWDTGIGIPIDKQHLIFQKFQQLETPMTRRYEGTGLGLVLTQRLARLHGGDVTFTSIEGEGSQFTLLLPPSPPQAGLSEQSTLTTDNRLVLVVEATQDQLEPLTRQLAELGYRVAIARSGTEAIEKTRRLQPCIVFLNPMLPMLSGWDVLVLLKADDETQHIPVVVTALRVEKNQAYHNGADGFLSLPVQPDALHVCLDRLIPAAVSQDPLARLTVLHLYGDLYRGEPAGDMHPIDHPIDHPLAQDINRLLHLHHCRVLEVDDLEQADLLTRVWKPDVVLVDGAIASPLEYMRQLKQYPFLSVLPLITLTPEVTYAANQVPGLSVFPCLRPISTVGAAIPALLQVVQHAAGIRWAPHILVADLSLLQDYAAADPLVQPSARGSLPALMQYIQIAGFRSSTGNSWQKIRQQLQNQSVDLFLLCVQSPAIHPLLLDIVEDLQQLRVKPPVLVRQMPAQQQESSQFEALWTTIGGRVLPSSLSMPDLLVQINQALSRTEDAVENR